MPFIRFLPDLAHYAKTWSQWYGGGIVGLAVFLIAVSLMRPETTAVCFECELFAPSIRDPARSQLVTQQPTVEEMRQWLLQGESSPSQLDFRIEWSCTNSDALLLRGKGSQLTQTKNRLSQLAAKLASLLNGQEKNVLVEHQQILTERVSAARQRVAGIENNLAVLVADFREAAARPAPSLAQLPERQPEPAVPVTPTLAAPQAAQPPPPMTNPAWTILQHELQQALSQLQELAVRYTREHPLMQAAQAQVDAIAAQLQTVPQHLSQPQPARSVESSLDFPPSEEQEELPIAGRTTIRRTNWQTPAANTNLQPYIDDFQRQSRELEQSRRDVARAEEDLRNFNNHLVAAQSNPAKISQAPALTAHRRKLPQNILLWAFVGSLIAGAVFANYMQQVPAEPLCSSSEVHSSIGMPVITTVAGGRSLELDHSQDEMRYERQIQSGAELAVIVIVAAFLISYLCDPQFADIVTADPFVAISEIWRRG